MATYRRHRSIQLRHTDGTEVEWRRYLRALNDGGITMAMGIIAAPAVLAVVVTNFPGLTTVLVVLPVLLGGGAAAFMLAGSAVDATSWAHVALYCVTALCAVAAIGILLTVVSAGEYSFALAIAMTAVCAMAGAAKGSARGVRARVNSKEAHR